MAPTKTVDSTKHSKAPKDGVNGTVTKKSPGAEAKPDKNVKSSRKKRKAQDNASRNPSKASRRSRRGATAQPIDSVKLINFLLSEDVLPLCRPRDESSDLESHGTNLRTYSTATFTPFEELVCALVLSRPIGHMLGMRSIRTLFNDPHNLSTPRAIKAVGKHGCRAALDEARTQHRQKTAEELVMLADAVGEHFGNDDDDTSLQKLRDSCDRDMGKEKEMLKKHVKGMAKTGTEIFARRIQGLWDEWYPSIDEKTLQALEDLGFEGDEEVLVKFLEEDLGRLDIAGFEGTDDEKKRKIFAKILERAIGVSLEGNVEEVRKAVV